MKILLLALMLAAAVAQQEGNLPAGHWCQRLQHNMPAAAHACSCAQHDCNSDKESAREDPKCRSYCAPDHCHCVVQDCK